MELIANWQRISTKFGVDITVDSPDKLPTVSEIVAQGFEINDAEYRINNRCVPLSVISDPAITTYIWTITGSGYLNGSLLTNVSKMTYTLEVDEEPVVDASMMLTNGNFTIIYEGVSLPDTLSIWFRTNEDRSYSNESPITLSGSSTGGTINLGNIALQVA